jgi:hypothetical protein
LIWSIFFLIIVVLYIYSIIKCFFNDKTEIFIIINILNVIPIPFWIINYFLIYGGYKASFGYIFFLNIGGFVTTFFLIIISYILQILIALPSVLYINFLYKNHSMKIIGCVLHTILQFVFLLGLFDSTYLIIKYRKNNEKANVA